MPFKVHTIIFFQKKKKMYLHYLKFSDLLHEKKKKKYFYFGLITYKLLVWI